MLLLLLAYVLNPLLYTMSVVMVVVLLVFGS